MRRALPLLILLASPITFCAFWSFKDIPDYAKPKLSQKGYVWALHDGVIPQKILYVSLGNVSYKIYITKKTNPYFVKCIMHKNCTFSGSVLHYRFEEGSGNITYDASGNGNTGTLYWMRELQFNGQNSYVNLNSPTNYGLWDNAFTTRTVCIRFYANDVTKRQFLYEEGGTVNGMNIYIYDGKVWFGAWAEGNGWNGAWISYPIEARRQYFVCAVFSGSLDMKLYVNGQLVNSTAVPTYIPAHGGNDYIGYCDDTKIETGDYSPLGDYFNGTIYEYILWTTNLTATQIADAYKGIFDVQPTVYYRAQEGVIQNGLLKDLSGNGYDVSVNNVVLRSPWVDGKWGKALRFDGVDDYVLVYNPNGFGFTNKEFTFTVWVKIDGPNLYGTKAEVIIHTNVPDLKLSYIYPSKEVYMHWWDGNKTVDIYAAMDTNSYHFIAATGNNTYGCLYVDGELKVCANISVLSTISTYTKIWIGSWDGIYATLNGIIDNIQIYNRSLSKEEIEALYAFYKLIDTDNDNINSSNQNNILRKLSNKIFAIIRHCHHEVPIFETMALI